MASLLAASTAYRTGQYAAIVTLAVLFVALIVRGSKGTGRPRRSRVTDAIAAIVVGVLLLGNAGRLGGDDSSDPWESQPATELRAGFLAGCESDAGRLVDCECAFDHIKSQPPYDTPSGFASLAEPVARAQQTQRLGDVPQVMLAALRACQRTAG
jgi:hypothetical protein